MDVMAPLGDFAREVGDAVYDRHGNELLGAGGRGRGTCLGKMRMGASRPPDARECKRRVCDRTTCPGRSAARSDALQPGIAKERQLPWRLARGGPENEGRRAY